MITYSFLHRGNKHDKVYLDDLYLLRQFRELDKAEYVCAPYILARHMLKCTERRLLCGHFITSIMERLGVANAAEHLRWATEVKPTLIMTRTELRQAKLMGERDNDLLDDDDASDDEDDDDDDDDDEADEEEQQPPVHQQAQAQIPIDQSSSSSFNFSGMQASLDQMLERQDMMMGRQDMMMGRQDMMMDHQRFMGSQVSRLSYQQEYWAPHVNHWIQTQRPSARPYSPPDIFMPASTTYGFYYPPRDQSAQGPSVGTGTGGASGSGGGMPQFGTYEHTQGARYSGPAYDYYASDFFSAPRTTDGDGTPSIYPMDDEQ